MGLFRSKKQGEAIAHPIYPTLLWVAGARQIQSFFGPFQDFNLGLKNHQDDFVDQFDPDMHAPLRQIFSADPAAPAPQDLPLLHYATHIFQPNLMAVSIDDQPGWQLTLIPVTPYQRRLGTLEAHLHQIEFESAILFNVLDALPQAVWAFDNQQHLFYCNQTYATLLEAPRNKIIKDNMWLTHARSATDQGNVTFHHPIVVGGQRRLFATTVAGQADGYGYGFSTDQTELEAEQRKLNEHMRYTQAILQQLSVPIVVFDSSQQLQFYNQAYLHLFDFDELFLSAKPKLSEILDDLRTRRKLPEFVDFVSFKRTMTDHFTSLLGAHQEVLHLPNGHTLRQVISPHAQGGLLFSYEDVTDNLALERQYNTLVAVQRETLDHLYEGISVFGSDNKLRLHNPAFVNLWDLGDHERETDGVIKLRLAEFLEMLQNQLLNPDYAAEVRENILKMLNHRMSATLHLKRLDNSVVQFSYTPLPDGSNLLSFVDISDRARFERALSERNEALRCSEHLKSKFISHVTYELRAPLNSVISFTDILLAEYFGPLTEKQRDYCMGIIEASQKQMMLINNILDQASIEAGQLMLSYSNITPTKLLDDVLLLIRTRAQEQGIHVSTTIDPTLTIFRADERRLHQVLFNLLTNAVKFTPTGGEIDISMKRKTTSDDREMVALQVQDTGSGISEADIRTIFTPFEKGKIKDTSQSGPGVGLSLVKNLIELHGGYIDVESEPSKGTRMTCVIPYLTN